MGTGCALLCTVCDSVHISAESKSIQSEVGTNPSTHQHNHTHEIDSQKGKGKGPHATCGLQPLSGTSAGFFSLKTNQVAGTRLLSSSAQHSTAHQPSTAMDVHRSGELDSTHPWTQKSCVRNRAEDISATHNNPPKPHCRVFGSTKTGRIYSVQPMTALPCQRRLTEGVWRLDTDSCSVRKTKQGGTLQPSRAGNERQLLAQAGTGLERPCVAGRMHLS